MKLGFYYHVPALKTKAGVFTPGFQGRFIDSLAEHCEKVVCFFHSPQASEISMMDYQITSKNVEVVDIGPHASVPQRLLSSSQVARVVREKSNQIDVMLIRGPSVLLPAIARGSRAPVALMLVNDYLAGLKSLDQAWWREWLIRVWAKVNFQQQMRISRQSLNIVNSRVLYEQLQGKVPYLIETRTTTLTKDDFFTREDTCQQKPYRLLFTGRITHEKGVLDMIDALAQVINMGEDVVLDLVGLIDEKEGILRTMDEKAVQLGISERVKYHGYRAVGPDLFDFYKKADIYIVASRVSEGFPRTIWEAMAHSLPVIATRVGSIPAFSNNAIELVNPEDPTELAGAIRKIIYSPSTRRQMIASGIKLAQFATLEETSATLIQNINSWLIDL